MATAVKDNGKATLGAIAPVSNDASWVVGSEEPYVAHVTVTGTAAILFHRWSVESVEAKSKASKGSKAKKEDDIESYVYRDDKGHIGIPGEYFRMAVIQAAKFRQDPRSPRKSAMDLFKAGIVALDEVCSLGIKEWDYLDRRRVMVQRNGITRVRPAVSPGWSVRLSVQILVPEYISPALLLDVFTQAGRLVGVGDFRPTFGRFAVTKFEVQS